MARTSSTSGRSICVAGSWVASGGEREHADQDDQARDEGLALLTDRYERDLMNPKEALSLGSVSSLVTPGESRRVLADNLSFLIRHYEPTPMGGVQREHE